MSSVRTVARFEDWRTQARQELLKAAHPSSIIWQASDDTQSFLFADDEAQPHVTGFLRLPKTFIECAKTAARHSDRSRWTLLYRVAWRILNDNRHLMEIETDPDVKAIRTLARQVNYDIYKMRSFVRFRRVEHDGVEQFVAWYRPDHHTLDANERFFVDRFAAMRWAILTPTTSLSWDLERVHYGPGVPRSDAPAEDELEDLWRAYYGSIYNPARLNLDAMRAQLPARRWIDLPESRMIPELVRISKQRVEGMVRPHRPSASALIPQGASLSSLRVGLSKCGACELCGRATQPVFGEGPPSAAILLVGEQPGDEEDRAGRLFVGPAGKVLDEAMRAAGIARDSVYLTNAVKAFRFEERGKRRIHSTPRASHISTCRPWLEAEIEQVQPRCILCLGSSAAQAVLGRAVRIVEERGRENASRFGARIIVTYHPSAALRATDHAARQTIVQALIHDLITAVSLGAV